MSGHLTDDLLVVQSMSQFFRNFTFEGVHVRNSLYYVSPGSRYILLHGRKRILHFMLNFLFTFLFSSTILNLLDY